MRRKIICFVVLLVAVITFGACGGPKKAQTKHGNFEDDISREFCERLDEKKVAFVTIRYSDLSGIYTYHLETGRSDIDDEISDVYQIITKYLKEDAYKNKRIVVEIATPSQNVGAWTDVVEFANFDNHTIVRASDTVKTFDHVYYMWVNGAGENVEMYDKDMDYTINHLVFYEQFKELEMLRIAGIVEEDYLSQDRNPYEIWPNIKDVRLDGFGYNILYNEREFSEWKKQRG